MSKNTAAPGIDLHAPCTEAVYALARKLLWIAYVWNDHNFDHPYQIARKLAEEFGIESFDQANAWLDEQAKLIDASPKGGSDARDQFEAWAAAQSFRASNIDTARDSVVPEWYVSDITALAWRAWQTAMQAASAEVGG